MAGDTAGRTKCLPLFRGLCYGNPLVARDSDSPGWSRAGASPHDHPRLSEIHMTQFQTIPTIELKTGTDGKRYVDYKAVDELRKMMTPNGKIYSRKRLQLQARDQKNLAQAIKRARFMALLPYTSATM